MDELQLHNKESYSLGGISELTGSLRVVIELVRNEVFLREFERPLLNS